MQHLALAAAFQSSEANDLAGPEGDFAAQFRRSAAETAT